VTVVNGLLAGGQIGYNYQVRQWVLGAEADASWADFSGNAKCAVFDGPNSGIGNSKINSLGSFTGRLGYAVGGGLMYYGKAGVAWSNIDYGIRSMTVGPYDYSGSVTRWGWTAGGGIAYAVTPHWSIDAEYDYMSFGDDDVSMSDPTYGASTVNISQRLHLFKVGFNYRFGD
jgi:outer membrane immunogenic protein